MPVSNRGEFYSDYSNSDKVEYLNKYTQSLYCPAANLITPYNENDLDHDRTETNGNADVTLEMDSVGNQYLHLVLPANRINFLNGLESGDDTFFNAQSDCDNPLFDSEGEQRPVMIEIGCKVFEVNRVAYRS